MSYIRIRYLLGPLLAMLPISQVSAQERFVARGDQLTVSVPMPGFHLQGGSEESRQSGSGPIGQKIVIDELIPAGESFDSWSSLFAIKLEEGLPHSLDQYVRQLKDIYFSACDGLYDPMIAMLEEQAALVMMIIPCQSYVDNPSQGEVGIFVIFKTEDDFINVYQHWRGNAFEGMNPASWPVSSAQMDIFFANAADIVAERQ